jgi:hypothetical protein
VSTQNGMPAISITASRAERREGIGLNILVAHFTQLCFSPRRSSLPPTRLVEAASIDQNVEKVGSSRTSEGVVVPHGPIFVLVVRALGFR